MIADGTENIFAVSVCLFALRDSGNTSQASVSVLFLPLILTGLGKRFKGARALLKKRV